MTRYLFRQSLLSLIKLLVFATIMFFLIQLIMPGDYVDQFSLFMNNQEREAMREQLGLNLPIGQRYLYWMGRLARFDLGESFTGESINDILGRVVPPTLLVFFVGTALAFMIGMWLGKATAWRGTGLVSRLATLGGITLFTSFPPWLAWLLAYFLTKGRQYVVMGERGGLRAAAFQGLDAQLWAVADLTPAEVTLRMFLTLLASLLLCLMLNVLLRRLIRRGLPGPVFVLLVATGTVGLWYLLGMEHLALDIVQISWLAILTYTLLSFGETMLIMQSSMTEVMKEEYVNTAHAKGLPGPAVREKHVARNALLPVLSRFIISLPYLITGVVIVESSVGWPGMGTTMWNALYWQNMPVVMAVVLIVGVLSLVARLILDVIIAYVDPRIRYTSQHITTGQV
ncbi:MAG: ABC transporter permease [Anaerolineae bacterium]